VNVEDAPRNANEKGRQDKPVVGSKGFMRDEELVADPDRDDDPRNNTKGGRYVIVLPRTVTNGLVADGGCDISCDCPNANSQRLVRIG
jgi:hypothetical protein